MSRTPSEDYRALSFWHESVPDRWRVRGHLPADEQADVAIVGAGFTGLWTAYYLLRAEPTLQVVVLEAETAGGSTLTSRRAGPSRWPDRRPS